MGMQVGDTRLYPRELDPFLKRLADFDRGVGRHRLNGFAVMIIERLKLRMGSLTKGES